MTSARVTSLDALREFRGQLAKFGQQAREALCTTELEIRRFVDWLETQLEHWQHQVRHCQEAVLRAKNELAQRKFSKADGRGWTDLELALRKAVARLEHAEHKVERTRWWIRNLPQAILEYQGPARQLAGMLEADLNRDLALLQSKIDALEAYLQPAQPAREPPSVPFGLAEETP